MWGITCLGFRVWDSRFYRVLGLEVLIRFKGCMVQGFGFGVPRGEVLGFPGGRGI